MLVESGNNLEVNCTLSCNDCTLSAARVNASMLNVSLRSTDKVQTVINERTVNVVFRHLYRNVSHQHVFCTLPGYEQYAQTTVIVAGLLKSWIWFHSNLVLEFCLILTSYFMYFWDSQEGLDWITI